MVRGDRGQDQPPQSRAHRRRTPASSTFTPLPAADYTEVWVRVTTSSTIHVRLMVYSVPARLIGERLRVHLYDDRLECYLGTTEVATRPRIYAPKGKRRARSIDYRHLIGSLVKKPMAFFHCQLRDDLLPSEVYRRIWQGLERRLDPRAACKLMVGVLALAADYDCEAAALVPFNSNEM